MTKPIDQDEALDQLYRANMERAQAAAKDHQKVMFDELVHGSGFSLDGKHVPHSDVYVVPADAPMVPGRKLTEALLEAGMPPRDYREYLNDRVKSKEEPSRSLISLIGSIAWRLLLVMVVVGVIVAVLAGGRV